MPVDAIDALLHRAIGRARELRRLPVSTYRLQFHQGFTFRDATKTLPYLASLGVTHVYASPYLAATPGSTHGYDVIDHSRLNPEVGTPADYDAFVAGLQANGLAHLLDTVPNHVGVATNDNTWWNDVLENGVLSRYAAYFDITWDADARPNRRGNRLLIPTLGKPFGQALRDGELRLAFDVDAGTFAVFYFERRFPISPTTYDRVLAPRIEEVKGGVGELREIIEAFRGLASPEDSSATPAALDQRADRVSENKSRLAALVIRKDAVRQHVEASVAAMNGAAGDAGGFDALHELLKDQHYRLADWHVAFDEINYRRFFDVNDLAALSMEKVEVFEATHRFILPLLADGRIAGLRIDHPDGLYDPAEYLLRLQQHFLLAVAERLYDGEDWPSMRQELLERLATFTGIGDGPDRWPLFVSVEKILAMDEPLIADWATHGTSGYDFLAMLNGLFVDGAAEATIDGLWQDVTGDDTPYEDIAYWNKRRIMETSMASELHMLTHRLDRIARNHPDAGDFTFRMLETALRETVACFGVYRTYLTGDDPITDTDRAHIERAIDKAKHRNPRLQPAVFDYLRDTLLREPYRRQTPEERSHQKRFIGKFQQLTSPVTAKGIEDTTFYQFNRFLSLNEVGGEPAKFGVSAEQFHVFLADRQKHWPFALSGSSTHDTKRSEDVRARLNVLADVPEEWATCVKQWFEVNASLRQASDDGPSPSPDEELLIYQTLIGAWPLGEEADFGDRVQAYVLKAIREAKLRTRWGEPDAAHEAAVKNYVDALIDPKRSPAFHKTFDPLRRKVSHFGLINSLSQTLIKIASPGVPDTYQGTELWDFSLVDPDNRRPVDYAARERLLNGLDAATPAELAKNLADGRAKLKVTSVALRLRRVMSDVFARGDYTPLRATGGKAAHVSGSSGRTPAKAWRY